VSRDGAGRRGVPAAAVLTAALTALVLPAAAPPPAAAAPALEPVVVTLAARADLRGLPHPRPQRLAEVVRRLRAAAAGAQRPVLDRLAQLAAAGEVTDVRPLWVTSAVALRAGPAVIAELAARPEVVSVEPDRVAAVPTRLPAATLAAAATTVAAVGAPQLWAGGLRGQGVVVASLDTGVQADHPYLAGSYRGGQNSWFDPTGQQADPVDASGHGTQTMSVVVGVAPDVHWITARIFDDTGRATVSGIHASLQWLLDPDRDPATADAPHVVLNSWSYANPGCDREFEPDLAALRAADIVPVFAAGNLGPAPGTSVSPGNNPSAVSVGAVDAKDRLWPGSSVGPGACDGGTYPDLVAPGVDVEVADLYGTSTTASGTSVAAPHVAGGLALLLSGHPGRSAADQEAAVLAGARDLGPPGVEDGTGAGELDLVAAAAWLTAHPPAPPPAPPVLLVSLAGTPGGADVAGFDGTRLTPVLDAAAAGLAGADVVGLARSGPDRYLLALGAAAAVPGLGTVTPWDVVELDAATGTFRWRLRGRQVGLTGPTERIDALAVLPDGRLLVSTRGPVVVPGQVGLGSDLMSVTAAGRWGVHVRGFRLGLFGPAENVDAAEVSADGRLVVSTSGPYTVPGAAGPGSDLLGCRLTGTGPATGCAAPLAVVHPGLAGATGGRAVDAIALP
jgi:subtilisin family serine protease